MVQKSKSSSGDVKNKMKKKYSGISLIELVIVLACILLLISLGVTLFVEAQARTRATTCLSNLKQISQALMMYVQDNDGNFPFLTAETMVNSRYFSHDSWYTCVEIYSHTELPACPIAIAPRFLRERTARPLRIGYALNGNLNDIITTSSVRHEEKYQPKTEMSIDFPASTVMVFDCRPGIEMLRGPDTARRMQDIDGTIILIDVAETLALPPGASRHSGGANYAFADGHVKWFTADNPELRKDFTLRRK